ncbi:hypothetical protein [Sporomusa malonica]|uniref:Uncharacterized protein n=1 Tax=Sporomusa malonica TaxID=112901 RepID=A0A1W1Z6Z2_9FIRM|nr:hypothetical protein [Sporomusa malonica]SMC44072.1 hypothetical protein SAMN04488500_10338 [Sporomusa malonica]
MQIPGFSGMLSMSGMSHNSGMTGMERMTCHSPQTKRAPIQVQSSFAAELSKSEIPYEETKDGTSQVNNSLASVQIYGNSEKVAINYAVSYRNINTYAPVSTALASSVYMTSQTLNYVVPLSSTLDLPSKNNES